ncbi:MAG: L,D-transpeptidase [Anaerolineales bacterium]|jgi:hypothetical protein
MKQKLLVLTLFTWFLLRALPGQTVRAADQPAQNAPSPAAPLCLPYQPEGTGTDCQELGPTAYLNALKAEGLILPRAPLPVSKIDDGFIELPHYYVKLTGNETPKFTSLDDTINNENPYEVLPPGFKYATIVDQYVGPDNNKHYMIDPGIWIRGGNTSGRVTPSSFTGMLFNGTPGHKFGWVIYETESQRFPGTANPQYTGRTLYRFDVIQVYKTAEMDGTTWLMIGPNEWIDKVKTALVYPVDSPPEGVTNGRWIEINLLEQTLSVYQDNRLIYATLTSTGIPGWWTRPGLFQIFEKLESTPMSGAFEADRSDYYYLEDVPWTMYFDQARALHGAYWHNYFGYEQSHGCVNLSPGDSHWLYLWANVGDYVYVWDPSGQTPIDENLYTAGGA